MPNYTDIIAVTTTSLGSLVQKNLIKTNMPSYHVLMGKRDDLFIEIYSFPQDGT